jgi:class 3 adenylate cyclase/sugar lactone lactonase YvrE
VSDPVSATATFLFTDIEGSTALLKTHRDAYAEILADHHRILREAFAAHGGKEIDNQGDSFFVAFPRAKDAVLAAADSQRALAAHAWPDAATVRVRMGIHTGEADLTADRYVGMSVHRAARISAVGHGGQVLVSPTTAGLLDDEDALPGVTLRSLGEHRLKDISRPVQLYQLEIEGFRNAFPPLRSEPPEPSRRRWVALAVVALVLLAAAAAAYVWTTRDDPPPSVVPDSLVRYDAKTLKPTDVFPIGAGADLVVTSGGYVWVTHHVLRDSESGTLRNAGDRTLTRVDPSTGNVDTVGGVAPCGLTPDPSGDVWVANCFAGKGGGSRANIQRIGAASLDFKKTWLVPTEDENFFRGLAYGGGFVWVTDASAASGQWRLVRVAPASGERRSYPLERDANALHWSGSYGDLWINGFASGTTTRLDVATGDLHTVPGVATNPSGLAVDGDTVWVGDWARPAVARVAARGPGNPRTIRLAEPKDSTSDVWSVSAGAGAVWAAGPRYGSIWKVDPATNAVTQIPVPYLPAGVAAGDDEVWVTVRGV